MRSLLISLLAAATLATGCGKAGADKTPAIASATYTVMDDSASQLRDDFNRARGSVRLLFVVDPVCPTCLRGLADLNDAVLSGTPDKHLQTFVVHEPVIGGTTSNIPLAAGLLQNPNVHHYWSASGAFGNRLAKAVGLKRGDAFVYAWDVWLIYGPEDVWDDAGPPRPRSLMHQLPPIPGFAYLDSKLFAREARELLAQLPATSPAP